MAKLLLSILGWGEMINIPEDIPDKIILLFSHTEIMDFYLIQLYKMAGYFDNIKDRLKILASYESVRPFFTRFNMNESNMLWVIQSDKGNTERITNELNKLDKFILFVGPKGSCEKIEWKKGWYHIAKATHTNYVCVAGLDFMEKKIKVIGGVQDISHYYNSVLETENGGPPIELIKKLKNQMSYIVPKRTKEEELSVDVGDVTIIPFYNDTFLFIIILTMIIILIAVVILFTFYLQI